jgi:hypothetical protein
MVLWSRALSLSLSLSPSISLSLQPQLVADIRAELENPTVDTYTAAREAVAHAIAELFHHDYVPSPAYQLYIKSIKLPERIERRYRK